MANLPLATFSAPGVPLYGQSSNLTPSTLTLSDPPVLVEMIANGFLSTFTISAYQTDSLEAIGQIRFEAQIPNKNAVYISGGPFGVTYVFNDDAFSANNISSGNITVSTLTAQTITASNKFTLDNQVLTADSNDLLLNGIPIATTTNISSIQDWSLEPAISTVYMNVNNILSANTIDAVRVSSLEGIFSTISANSITVNTLVAQSTINIVNYLSASSVLANTGNFSSIVVSSINGAEFTPGGVVVSTLTASNIFASEISSGVGTFTQSFLSSMNFSPSFNPQFNVNLGLGEGLAGAAAAFGTGLMGAAVAVPVTAGTIFYGITGGLASLFAPRPINNINSNVYEQINYTSQLQVSTLNTQISTIFRTLSTIPSTIVINPSGGTVSSIDIEIFTSTISAGPPITAIRSVGDPLQLVSTPWTYYQSFGQWVEIPSGGTTVGSNLNLSTLTLLQSTILKSDPFAGATLQVLEAQAPTNYGQVEAQVYRMAGSIGGSNGTLYYRDLENRPGFINNGGSTFTLAYTSDIPAAENLAVTLSNGNSAGACNINMNSNSIFNVNSIGATPVGPFGGAVTGFRTYTIANPTDNDFATINYTVTDTTRFPSTIGANRGMLFHNEPDTINEGYIGYDRVEMNDGNSTGLSRMTFSNIELSYGPPGLNRTMRMFAAQGTGEGWVEAAANISTATLLSDVYARLDVNNALDPNVTLYSSEAGSQISNVGILQVQLDKRSLIHSDARASPSTFLISTNTSIEIRPKVSIIQDSAGGTADGLFFLNNTSATAGAVSAQFYKQRNSIQNDTISEVLFFANDAVGDKTQFAAIKCSATNVTSGNEDGSVDIWTSVNGTPQQVFRFNGADNENNSFRPLDMNANNILNTSNFGLSATGGGYGVVGQSLVSGQGLGNRWNYNMAGASIAGTGGGSSLVAGTFTDIIGGLAISLPVGSIVISPVNKYRVTAVGTFSDVNADIRMYMEIQASGAGAVAGGQTFNSANDLYYYTTDVNFGGGGSHFTTFSFSDVFTCTLVAGGTCTVNLWVEPGSGSHTIANNRHTVSIEPLYA